MDFTVSEKTVELLVKAFKIGCGTVLISSFVIFLSLVVEIISLRLHTHRLLKQICTADYLKSHKIKDSNRAIMGCIGDKIKGWSQEDVHSYLIKNNFCEYFGSQEFDQERKLTIFKDSKGKITAQYLSEEDRTISVGFYKGQTWKYIEEWDCNPRILIPIRGDLLAIIYDKHNRVITWTEES